MANKNVIRSIRISDEMMQLINQQVGDTFTEKWENLIFRCVYEIPQKQKELESVQAQLDFKYDELRHATYLLTRIENVCDSFESAKRELCAFFDNVASMDSAFSGQGGGS